MRGPRLFLPVLALGLVVAVLPACGGGGQGYRNANSSTLSVEPTSIPPRDSGQLLDFPIPLQGGCGGPIVMQVMSGRLPPGLYLDEENPSIKGYLLEHGEFDFTINVIDTGCEPFASTQVTYAMSVGQGDITVVDVNRSGQLVGLIPAGEGEYTYIFGNPADPEAEFTYQYNPDLPALPQTICNSPVNLDFICAGGAGAPYKMKVDVEYDHGNDPPTPTTQEPPLGMVVVQNSVSFYGAPVGEGPSITITDDQGVERQVSGPFTFKFVITDKAGNEGVWKCNWLVFSPPLVMVTKVGDLPDGECGKEYLAGIQLTGGVAPIVHEFTNPRDGDSHADETVYPPATDNGGGSYDYTTSYAGAPPEGMFLADDFSLVNDEATRYVSITGTPRRRGTFELHYHAYASLAPGAATQNARMVDTIYIAPAPAVLQDHTYTMDGPGFAPTAPYNRIAEMEAGASYNPDGGADGLQFKARGGVPRDGLPDYPHQTQVDDPNNAIQETPGTYAWGMDWWPAGENQGTGDSDTPIPGTEFLDTGILRLDPDPLAPDLETQSWQVLAPVVYDQELPYGPASAGFPDGTPRNTQQKVRVSVGPDLVLITRSTKSWSPATSDYDGQSGDATGFNDDKMTVMLMKAGTGSMSVTALTDDNLAGDGTFKHAVPITGVALSTLLTDIDPLRMSVNPTGWWDDSFNLNPKAARGLAHGDPNHGQYYWGNSYNSLYQYQSGSYEYAYARGAMPEASAIDIPRCSDSSVDHNPEEGVYTDGGRLYVFDSKSYIGLFIIREDGRIYVPAAYSKSTYKAFGDNWLYDWTGTYPEGITATKMPQITVSPDGRYAAMKLLKNRYVWSGYSNYGYSYTPHYKYTCGDTYYRPTSGDTVSDSQILIFSLTGERPFGSSSASKLIKPGSTSSSTGLYQYASSLALSNDHLYYLTGNQLRGSFLGLTWGFDQFTGRESWLWRYETESTATAGTLLDFPDTDMNTSDDPIQVPFHFFTEPGTSYGSSSSTHEYNNMSTSYCLNNDGANWHESSAAPSPFRVSADGSTMAILAGEEPATPMPSDLQADDFWNYKVWADRGGTEAEEVSTVARHSPAGGGRGSRIRRGPAYMDGWAWGAGSGPTTQFEVSDDGSRIAVVVNREDGDLYNQYFYQYYYTGSDYVYQYGTPYPEFNWNDREDIIAFTRATDGTWSETQVTGTESADGPNFASGTYKWRFGGLTFTAENDGLVFWGGFNNYDPRSPTSNSTYSNSQYLMFQYTGSIYSYSFDDDVVYHVLDDTDGGSDDAVGKAYDGSTAAKQAGYGWGTTTGYQGYPGVIVPVGGFLSQDRNFAYYMTKGALNTTSTRGRTQHRLIGVNIRSVDGIGSTSPAINGHPDGEAFAVGKNGSADQWLERRGFVWDWNGTTHQMYHYRGINDYYTPAGQAGCNTKMARDNGRVFFAAHWQGGGPSNYATSYSYGGPSNPTYFTPYYPACGELAVFDSNVGGNPILLSSLGGTTGTYAQSTLRAIPYIEITPDGQEAMYLYARNGYTTSGSSSTGYIGWQYEQLGYVAGIQLDPTTGALVQRAEYENVAAGQGRISSAFSPGPAGSTAYYGFGTGSNEASKQLRKSALGGTISTTSTGGTAYRYNVLHAFR